MYHSLVSFFLLIALLTGCKSEATSLEKGSKQVTFTLIKPHAVAEGKSGEILAAIEAAGFHIAALKMTQLDATKARQFYEHLREESFFPDIVAAMTRSPLIAAVLEGDEAVTRYRQFLGATDPKKAEKETLRARFGRSIDQNAVHGSDSDPSAQREISFFFSQEEIFLTDKQ